MDRQDHHKRGSVVTPFRVGSTSYVIPDHIIPNVESLGPLVDDVQLLLFETDEHGSNLPDAGQVRRLNGLAEEHDLTYTVHLPLDLRLGDGGDDGHISLIKAQRVIDATRDLHPQAYTLHLDGNLFMEDGGVPSSAPGVVTAGTAAEDLRHWQQASIEALRVVSDWVDEPARLGIENLEAWDPELFAPVVEALPVGRTIDVGHLWLQGVDPLEHLRRWIHRARVIHLHGIGERDHASLALVSPDDLDRVTAFLLTHFTGVVTLEVFDLADLTSSLEALDESVRRTRTPSPDWGPDGGRHHTDTTKGVTCGDG